MVKHFTVQMFSVMPQPVSQKLLRGKVDVTDQMQFKLVQKTQSARSALRPKAAVSQSKRLNDNLKQLSSIGYDASELFTRDSLIPLWMVSPTSNISSKPSMQSSSIVVDDSLLLNLLKQIVDFEYNQTQSPVVSQPLLQDMEQSKQLSDQRDAVFGVLRSAIVAAAESSISPIESMIKEDFAQSSILPTSQVQSSSVEPNKDSMGRLIAKASRLADLISPKSFSSVVTKTAQNIELRLEMQHIAQEIVWHLRHSKTSKVDFNDNITTKVVERSVLPRIQENEFSTAPIWYQQGMENGPPMEVKLANPGNLTSHKQYTM